VSAYTSSLCYPVMALTRHRTGQRSDSTGTNCGEGREVSLDV
jgi:hypothetical protein